MVGFGNLREVETFIGSISGLNGADRFDIEYLVTVNRGNVEDFRTALCGNFSQPQNKPLYAESVTVIDPGDNIGYLPACALGLNNYIQRRGHPDWVCISNTDLELGENFFSLFEHSQENLGQVSALVKTESGLVQNPHLLQRPSKRSMQIRLLIHYWSWIGAIYMTASKAFARTKAQATSERRLPDLVEQYASHGSLFLLSNRFFSAGGTLDDSPKLYSEEIYIGEQLRQLRQTSVCDTRVRISHRAHTSTGFLSLRARSRMMSNSNKMLYRKFFSDK